MLRIISGERRGRVIKSIPGSNTRPTTDRVKESLFNILQPKIPGSYVLDLFSGTGSLGLEALSRGAERAVFVEKNPKAVNILNENCQSLDYEEYTEILPYDIKKAMSILNKQNITFDIIFMDPPYERNFEAPTIQSLGEFNLLGHDGIIVVEHLLLDKPPQCIGSFIRYDLRKYGNTAISFYRKDTCHT